MKCPRCCKSVTDVHFHYEKLNSTKSDEDVARLDCGCQIERGADLIFFEALEHKKGKQSERKRSQRRSLARH